LERAPRSLRFPYPTLFRSPEGGKTMSVKHAHPRGLASLVAASLLVVTMSAAQALAQTEVHMLVSFDESAGQNTEGMAIDRVGARSEEHTSELQSLAYLVCR